MITAPQRALERRPHGYALRVFLSMRSARETFTNVAQHRPVSTFS
jgi:hypothetical protein